MSRSAIALLAIAIVGCGHDVDLGAQRSAIVDGRLDPGHPEVGEVDLGVGRCTGTLIGPRTVLTAAHCVTRATSAPFDVAPRLAFLLAGQRYEAASAAVHPDYRVPCWRCADVAVIRLVRPVVGVTPALVATAPPRVSEPVSLVGFGLTATEAAYSTAGTKRVSENTISEVFPLSITYYGTSGGSTCFGDSGGPTFALRAGVEQLIAVHSSAPDGASEADACEYGGLDVRSDAVHRWIVEQSHGDLQRSSAEQRTGPEQPLDASHAGPAADGDQLGSCNVAAAPVASWPTLLLLVTLLACRRRRATRPRTPAPRPPAAPAPVRAGKRRSRRSATHRA